MQLNLVTFDAGRRGALRSQHDDALIIFRLPPLGISFSPMLLLDVVAMNPCIFFLTVSSFKEDAVVIFAS